MPFKLDTGAQINVISESVFNLMKPRPTLQETNIRVTGYSGANIPVKGRCLAKVTYKTKVHTLSFIVVPKNVQAILGLSSCERLNLVKRVLVLETGSDPEYEGLLEEYRDLFNGLGCLPGEHTIRIDKTVPPVVHPCRKVPFALQDQLKAELDRMESMGVIAKIDEPTEWVNSLVIVDKKNGKLRICLDPRDLNKAIKREHFKLPTREEIMSQFANAKYFSKLDASSGFWQLKLDEDSSKLCTFNSPYARYRFLRLPFGIASAPEVYHKTIHMLYEHIEGVDTSMDDIIIWGTTKEEHDSRLRKVLEATRQANLKLNKEKCQLGLKELKFVGDIISDQGVRPDPMKISAIKYMKKPQNVKDVQRFLGMVNYMGKFIPNLSEKIAPLRWLLEKKNAWNWNHEQETAWQHLKEVLTHEPVLKFYDPAKAIKISSDASQNGIGAVLLQDHDSTWQPVAYASRSMSGAETRYAQIEKELLSILFACNRFRQCISGQLVNVETDHKPLITLFTKSLNDCPLRIQRLMIKLQRYTLKVTFTPGKMMYTADALSRAVDERAGQDDKVAEEIQAYVDMVTSAMPITDAKMQMICQETEKDSTLDRVKRAIQIGWPDVKQSCIDGVQEYWNCRAELTVVNGIIFKGSKIVIPHSLRKLMLEKIHEGHLGIEKCRKRAREVMFWPRMNQDISDIVASCDTCLKYHVCNAKEPLQPHPVPERPYQKVGVDLFTCNNTDFVIINDYHSLYPESNGLIEKSVGIVKKLMQKSEESKSEFYKALLAYRSTPLACGYSPAQLLMGRRLRTNLPMKDDLLARRTGAQVKQFKENQKEKQKVYFDSRVKSLPELHKGEKVRIKDKDNTWTQKGSIDEQVQPRSYTIRTEEGRIIRRNRRDILKEPEQKCSNTESDGVLYCNTETESETDQVVRRSTRRRKSPERLIKSC
ncbi:uncharacterized protein K02A2.6-like [Spea bombifrons]|uniref:uncharacterized protein K02A2.6-like n=1 Tax=Spea bombifrons TaxID=233779 RepID=UPI00234B6789|nr:uncharacterized protein K02A2.6-like [Spea bombifrons]